MIDQILRTPLRLASAMRNAMEMRQLGERVRTARTPYEVVESDPVLRLRRYHQAPGATRSGADGAAPSTPEKRRPAIILVPPLMLTAEVYDIAAEGSAVGALLEAGIDPWVVDFGAPERLEGGLRRTLTDHVLAVSRAVDRARQETGGDVHLGGYSQGGMFCYEAAAYRRSAGLASVITFGSPVDVRRDVIPGVPDEVAGWIVDTVAPLIIQPFSATAVPAWLSRNVFKLLSPAKELQNQIQLLTGLYDRDSTTRREGQRRFLAGEGWVAWPGPALRDFVEQFLIQNRLLSGGFVVEGRTLTLADVTCPVLVFVGTTDEIARPAAVRSIREAAPGAEVYECTLKAGHFGLVVGSRAMHDTWPIVARWLRWRDRIGRKPGRVVPAAEIETGHAEAVENGAAFWNLAWESLEMVGGAAIDGTRTALHVIQDIRRQLPRLSRLSGVRRDTRIGLALSLSEQAEENPDGTFFLYQGRAYSYADANRRVDAVVRGLLSVGIRQGEHVGIYMRSRPSALALTAAINRLGAVAVLLRPGGGLAREAKLGEIQHLITDPDHGERARDLLEREVLVLGGGGEPRALPAGLIDMEAIDPDRVAVPEWYTPSPGRAEDVAFILFAGRDESTRVNRITNRRWALSALGTASAAAMCATDGGYCWTPIQHPTGLLVSISSALVSGARLGVANGFTAETFWEEVRRYGSSVVFYAGTMCRELVDAPPVAAERGHPVRLFAGSGMPAPLWRRVVERFGPVGVLEFYATTEGTAILGNVSGEKIGSVGRPLPGSAEVALAAYDPARRCLVQEASGYAVPVTDGEPGLLLARVDRDRGVVEGRPLRSVFERGDAWYATDHLFRRDADGDYWLVDHVNDIIHHASGPVPSIPIEETAGEYDSVSAAAAFGVQLPGADSEVPVVAVLPRPRGRFDPVRLGEHLERHLSPEVLPIVRIVDEIPMTAGYRFRKKDLRQAGLPKGDLNRQRIYGYDPDRGGYRALDAADLERGPAAAPSRRQPATGKRSSSGRRDRRRR